MRKNRSFSQSLMCLLSSALFLLPVAGAQAQTWPERPIRLLVPYAPGGSSDVVARAVASEMSKDLGQQVVVENKGGAQGMIATTEVARAKPDGYTLILGHVGTLAVNPSMIPKLPYDPRRDFAPITLLAKLPMVFALGNGVDAADFSSFVALAKSKPGVMNYGSAGNGSAGHLAFEMLKMATGINVVHVPYKGTGAQLNDLLGGFIDAAAAGTPGLLPAAQAGKIKIIAVGSKKRLAVLPDIPTVEQAGYPGFESSQWFGLLAPAGTPESIVERLHKSALVALKSTSVRRRMEYDASEISGAGPQQFAAFINSEERRWRQVVHSARLSVE